jgi:hypothetical protein
MTNNGIAEFTAETDSVDYFDCNIDTFPSSPIGVKKVKVCQCKTIEMDDIF